MHRARNRGKEKRRKEGCNKSVSCDDTAVGTEHLILGGLFVCLWMERERERVRVGGGYGGKESKNADKRSAKWSGGRATDDRFLKQTLEEVLGGGVAPPY